MLIHAEEERGYIRRILVKAGVGEGDARIVAESLTLSNLRGVDSHGIMRLPIYVERLQKALMESDANIRVIKEDPVSAIVDGCNSLAQVTARKAMAQAIEKAKQSTLGLVLVKNSNHFGTAAEYSLMAASAGMIGIVASNTVPLMPPTGGKEKILGNNPLSIAFPGGKYGEVVLDMALSNVALGKILNADSNQASIPDGWGVDEDGNSTTDPKRVIQGGFLLPVGGPKGYGLALAVEVLAAVLTNSPVSKEVKSLYQLKEKLGISHLFLAINVNRFIDSAAYKNRVETLLDYIKRCPTASGVEEIYLPGEIEKKCLQKRSREGIHISDELTAQLNSLSDALGVERLKGWEGQTA